VVILDIMSSELSTIGYEYIKICEEIKQANDSLKQKKDLKKALHEKILKTMAESNIAELPLSNGTIFLDKKEKKEPLNKKNIVNSLREYCDGDMTRADKIASTVLGNIPKKQILKIRVDN